MILDKALRILRENLIVFFSSLDNEDMYHSFVKLDDMDKNSAVIIRDKGDVEVKIKLVNLIKPALVIVPTAYFGKVKCNVIGTRDPRLAYALIQGGDNTVQCRLRIGRATHIAESCLIGVDGLSANRHNDDLIHTPHIGGVTIGNYVRINGFTAVERAVFGETMIGANCHIDYHCVIGHGATLGERCRLAPGVLVLGGAVIGDDVAIGAGAVINPGVHIGKGAVIGSGSVVICDIEPGELAYGVPAKAQKHVGESRKCTW